MKRIMLNAIAMFFVFTILSGSVAAQESLKQLSYKKSPKFSEIQKAYQEYFDEVGSTDKKMIKQFGRWQWFWQNRLDENGNFPSSKAIQKEVAQFLENEELLVNTLQWTPKGPMIEPTDSENMSGIGRVNKITVDPNDLETVWAGSPAGGVWKTTDHGETWTAMLLDEFVSIGVSDIAISKDNSDVVYVATGDADGSAASSPAPYSVGLIKTTDGGQTWTETGLSYDVTEGVTISRVLIDPDNSSRIYVAANNGLYISNDAGETFKKKVVASLADMEINPENSSELIASTKAWGTNAIYYSSDKGESWETAKTFSGSRRIAIEYGPDNYAYAIVAANDRTFKSFVRSTDGGSSWDIRMEGNTNSNNNILGGDYGADWDRGQGEYDLCLVVDPEDKDVVYTGGINMWMTDNGGKTFDLLTSWNGQYGKTYLHADFHDLVFNKEEGILYAAHDGGIDYSLDGGSAWEEMSDGMNITQFYRMSSSKTDIDYFVAGCQDNGTFLNRDGEYKEISGGDGMNCIIDPENESIVYSSVYNGTIYVYSNYGKTFSRFITASRVDQSERGAWVTPYQLEPGNSSTIYIGYKAVWKNTKRGQNGSWVKISNFSNSYPLEVLEISKINKNYIYAAVRGNLWMTSNGGGSWTKMNVPNGLSSISSVAIHPENPASIVITDQSFRSGSKVYLYDGSEWTNISGNIPNIPVNYAIIQNNSPNRIYIGTDIGVLYSENYSASWHKHGKDLPNVIVMQLEIIEKENILRAATFGRGVWDSPLNTCNLPTPELNIIGSTTFCPGESVELEAVGDFHKIVWNTGETSTKITVTEAGQYSYTVIAEDGCSTSSESVQVNVYPVKDLKIDPGSNYPFCDGQVEEIELKASLGFETYTWSNGETGRKITVNELGTYTVTGISSDGCTTVSEEFVLKLEERPEQPGYWRSKDTLWVDEEFAGYQWYLDDQKIFGANERKYVIEEGAFGDYTCEVSNQAGCTVTTEPFTIDETNGIEDNTIDQYVTLAPSVTNSTFKVSLNLDNIGGVDFVVTDINGNIIVNDLYMNEAGLFEKTVDLSDQAAGVYIINIQTTGHNWTGKVVKY